ITMRAMRKRRLRRSAQSSLVARAQLERLRLPAETESVLSGFDITTRNVAELLEEPAIKAVSLSGTIARDLEDAREQLYAMVVRETKLAVDLRDLNRLHSTPSVSSSSADIREQIRRVRAQEEEIAINARRLVERLQDVRQLSGASQPAGEPVRVALE